MASVRIILYRPVIDFMRGWQGDIGRSVSRLANSMAVGQRLVAPKKTGRLVSTIGVGQKGYWARGIECHVGANPGLVGGLRGYGYWTDQGAPPHPIHPKPTNKRGLLVFYWARVGHVVYFRRIKMHPGIRNPSHWAERGAGIGMAVWDATGGSL